MSEQPERWITSMITSARWIRGRGSEHAGVGRMEMNTMKMQTYGNFAGTCAKAFRFYEKHLAAEIGMMMTHAQAPDQSNVRPEWKDAILLARVSLGGTELMGADIPSAQPMRSAYLSLGVDSDAEAERIFSALSDGGDGF